MGYYSKVAIAIEKSDEPKMLEAMRQYDQETKARAELKGYTSPCLAQELLDCADRFETVDGATVVYRWDWIKWCEDYDDVRFFAECLPVPCDFIRIGEELGDIERREDLSANVLFVTQSIHLDGVADVDNGV